MIKKARVLVIFTLAVVFVGVRTGEAATVVDHPNEMIDTSYSRMPLT
jgi:hypothetical protein